MTPLLNLVRDDPETEETPVPRRREDSSAWLARHTGSEAQMSRLLAGKLEVPRFRPDDFGGPADPAIFHVVMSREEAESKLGPLVMSPSVARYIASCPERPVTTVRPVPKLPAGGDAICVEPGCTKLRKVTHQGIVMDRCQRCSNLHSRALKRARRAETRSATA